jgi:hypothetical protein
MRPRSAFSTVLSLLVLSLVAVNLAGALRDGAVDARLAQAGGCRLRVVAAGPSALGAGLRIGDLVDPQALSPAQRTALQEGPAGGRAVLAVVRDGTVQMLSVPYVRTAPTAFDVLFAGAGILVYLAAGAFVLFGGRDAASFGLGIFLISFAGAAFNFNKDGYLAPGVRVPLDLAQYTLATLTIYGAFMLNEALSRGVLPERVLRGLRRVVVAYCAVFWIVTAGTQILFPLTGCSVPLSEYTLYLYLGGAAGVIAILGATIVRARGSDPRLSWIFWTTVLCFGPYIAVSAADRLFGVALLNDPYLRLAVELVPFLTLPVVYAYVILRYRVIDVSFVLNRALAYTVLTTLLLGGVILAETFTEKIALSRNASLLLELAVPLALGLSFDALQKRLQSGIDRVLFRAKHRAEAALLAFARDCTFIERVATLRLRTVENVLEQSRATGVALYERTGTGYRLAQAAGAVAFPGDLDADDGAFVRMRATLGPVDLAEMASSAARGGLAFPLAVGGLLDGALVCTPRASGEVYAPDERELLQRVTQAVAAALTATRARERAEFVAAVADGALDLDQATARARDLRENG